jgi:protein O-GlcNAc transferase
VKILCSIPALYRLAGIFLDTTPYNAHTTASDALRSGLPVLTVRGHSFQSRVASSMVTTLGLPELCVADLREYEEFAVRIGSDPQFERALNDKLAGLVKTADLYDSTSMARKIENAYHQMWRERK